MYMDKMLMTPEGKKKLSQLKNNDNEGKDSYEQES